MTKNPELFAPIDGVRDLKEGAGDPIFTYYLATESAPVLVARRTLIGVTIGNLHTASGRALCWGCRWSGDVIRFVHDHYGLTFGEALSRLEQQNGLDGVSASPVRREKRVRERRQRTDAPCGYPLRTELTINILT